MSELLAAGEKPALKAPKRAMPVVETGVLEVETGAPGGPVVEAAVVEVTLTQPSVANVREAPPNAFSATETVWRLERHPIPGGHLLQPFKLVLPRRARCLGVFGEHSYDMMVLVPIGDVESPVERTFVQVRGNGTLHTPPEVQYIGRYAQYGTQAVAVFELVA